MAVGDLAVPRKMKAIGEAFYGRKRAYTAAMAQPGPGALATAFARNIYGGAAGNTAPAGGLVGEGLVAEGLAAYVREAVRRLDALDAAALQRGQVAFPDPLAFASPGSTDAMSAGAP